MTFVIRKAVKADAKAAHEIRQRAIWAKCVADYPEAQLKLWTEGGMSERFIADIERAFYVAESEQGVIGTAMLNTEHGIGKVDAIFVAPDYMGKGVARALMAHIETLARESGVTALKLDATLNAADFYRARGFTGDEIAVYRSPKGLELACVPMVKSLD
ncbi:GNAT family N-acetyltransferase [Photobacterium sp. CCB-ST2H9]|uniref:GNAT family N-acetyltransferase n=1 Tax=unclassified Photobacterium TaxID=2628852 RepID=UPI002005EEE9|nr:GNAT family N-acetyltransferase [Photobacterium sp. CCB-ST2H9]UTM59390.1 GNAT family N-acetyltransferase [Photobacterium sp. CCB-ST2H9]